MKRPLSELVESSHGVGRLFTRDRGHESPRVKELCGRFLKAYRARKGSIDCAPGN
jgi:hypothetical protein